MTRNGFSRESDPFPIEAGGSCFFSTPALRHRPDTILRLPSPSAKPFAEHSTPAGEAAGDSDTRWNTGCQPWTPPR